jgi:hypothetical protein
VRPSSIRASPATNSTAPVTIKNLAKCGIDLSLPKATMLIPSPTTREKLNIKKKRRREGGIVLGRMTFVLGIGQLFVSQST